MKILVLKSSGNKKGSSNMLADEFIKGASKNGHKITEFDVIRKKINPWAVFNLAKEVWEVKEGDSQNDL